MKTTEGNDVVERRRRWSREEKLRIVAESARPESTVSQIARAHRIAPGQLFNWRRQFLARTIDDSRESGVSLRISTATAPSAPGTPLSPIERHIDIKLPSGIVVSVRGDVEVDVLRRVLTALSGQ
jgi:transposase